MRNGVLLAEDAPIKLLERCHVSSLEDAFLLLSQEQEKEIEVMYFSKLPCVLVIEERKKNSSDSST